MARTPSVFISYSWDSAQHKTWVRKLAERLVLNGINVWLDEWHVKAGDSLTAFMERKIAASGHVLVICTPDYAKRANSRRGGVGYEQQIISGRIAGGVARRKFIPILRKGSIAPGKNSAIPTHFSGAFVLDMSSARRSSNNFEELLRAIYRVPKYAPPERGALLWSTKPTKSVRLATEEFEGWWLASGVARNQKYPKTFEIPSEKSRNAVREGDYVKLAFETYLDDEGFSGERMWVRISGVNGPYLVGTVSNKPVVMPLKFGSKVAFLPEHIISIAPAEDADLLGKAVSKKQAKASSKPKAGQAQSRGGKKAVKRPSRGR